MMRLYFLSLEDVLEIHSDQMSRYGGKTGLRDRNLLLSAIAQHSACLKGNIFINPFYDKAAAYLFHLCQNHPFIHGNKRVALVSSLLFLAMNNCAFEYHEKELEKMVISVAEGKMKKTAISKFFSQKA